MLPANGDKLLLGRGAILFERSDAPGLVFLGNCETLTLSTEDERQEKYSSTQAASIKIAEAVSQRTCSISVTGDEFDAYNLALVLMGEEATYSQTGDAITGEEVSDGVVLGRYYTLAERDISALSLTGDPGGGDNALIEDTDYRIVDAQRGVIQILEAAENIADGEALEADYTSGAITALRMIRGAVSSRIDGRLLFLGDPSAGPAYELEVWRCTIRPEGELPLISGEYAQWQFTAEVLDDSANHPTEPLYRLLERQAPSA